MATEYGTRLKAARKHADLTQKEASDRTGIPQSTISTAERQGHGSGDTPVYARVYGVSALWLATGEGEMVARVGNTVLQETHSAFEMSGPARSRPVPVVGMARLGENGYYEEISSTTGAGDGTVQAYSQDPNAYALRVRGDSMFPAIRDGWFVVIEPGATPTPGEYVLVKLRNGQKMVKELIMVRPDSITVVSVNGETRRTITLDELDQHMGLQSVVAILTPSKWNPD